MGFFEQTLPSIEDAPLLPLSSPLPLSEQALLLPAVEAFPAFFARLEAVAIVAWWPFVVLGPVSPIFPSIFLSPSYFLFCFYLE